MTYSRAVRVIQICPLLPPHYNGCGDGADRLAREFLARGDRVLVLTDDLEGVKVGYDARTLGGSWGSEALHRTLAQAASFQPNVALLQYTTFLYPPRSLYPMRVLRALRAAGYSTAIYAHELFYPAASPAVRGSLKAAYLGIRDRLTLMGADRIFVANARKRNEIAARAPWLARRVHVVPFGANIEPSAPPGERSTAQPPFRLVAFGIVMPRRRIDLLIRMMGVLQDLGIDCRLDIVGRIQEAGYANQCRRLAEQLSVERRVSFAGPATPDEIGTLFAGSDLYLHAAEEGTVSSAGSLLAALAHGVPVLAARTSHDDPLFAEAVAFAEAEPLALARAAAALLRNVDELRTRGAHARALYDHQFGWAHLAERVAGTHQPKTGDTVPQRGS